MTREHHSSHSFSARAINKVGYETVDSEGNVSIFGIVAGVTQEILDARQRHAEMTRQTQYENQVIQR